MKILKNDEMLRKVHSNGLMGAVAALAAAPSAL